MILIDSNVPMYLVDRAHPHKIDAQRVLERLIADGERLVTDAEGLMVTSVWPARGPGPGSWSSSTCQTWAGGAG